MHPKEYAALRAASIVGTSENSAEPEFGSIPATSKKFGISTRQIYRLASDGRITLRKLGRRTLVDLGSVRAFVRTLPQASIRIR